MLLTSFIQLPYLRSAKSELVGAQFVIVILLDSVFPALRLPCSMLIFRDGSLPSFIFELLLIKGGICPSRTGFLSDVEIGFSEMVWMVDELASSTCNCVSIVVFSRS